MGKPRRKMTQSLSYNVEASKQLFIEVKPNLASNLSDSSATNPSLCFYFEDLSLVQANSRNKMSVSFVSNLNITPSGGPINLTNHSTPKRQTPIPRKYTEDFGSALK